MPHSPVAWAMNYGRTYSLENEEEIVGHFTSISGGIRVSIKLDV